MSFKNITNRLILVFIIIWSSNFSTQIFSQKYVPQKLLSQYYQPNFTSNYYNLKDIFHIKKNILNGRDETVIIQKIIDNNNIVLLPNTTIYINKNGLKIGSNKKILFQKNTKIKFLGGTRGKLSDVLKIYNAKNVEIINAVIVGSRNNNINQSGQWNGAISVLNSSNVTIINPKITESYGDGITIGSEDGGFSENVLVSGGWIDTSRRNGISITSGKKITVQNIFVSNTYGQEPESGIDIEASWNKDVLLDINVKNVCTFNNSSTGISINLNGLATDKSKDVKFTSITIDGHTDIESRHGLLTSLNTIPHTFDTKGSILIKNANWKSSREISYWKSSKDHSINITFSNIKIDDIQKKNYFENSIKNLKNIKLQD
ncbi:glycoside hydrolase family 28 protein [Chryseobacterium chendengshani]|uniref:glycoside hydrolase family 28 protein n=1 Tax=Chryseobacterium sp. LJ756 TaxID=2864113 RepID=UPI001C640F4E|nr:glycoside hydrolase family 28 protein [Chryseobacterium sp. LJ756]MBW7676640.1 glycoside hydrolase family 28 protein [Chryseobacterium sp. LJ756]